MRLALGENIISGGEAASGVAPGTLLKRVIDNGTYENYTWGGEESKRVASPLVKSAWSELGSYKTLVLGYTSRSFLEESVLNRDRRYKTVVEFERTIVPLGTPLTDVKIVFGLIKGIPSQDTATLSNILMSEYLSKEYSSVVAIGEVGRVLDDTQFASEPNEGIQKWSGVASVVKDSILTTADVLHLMVLVIVPNSSFVGISSVGYAVHSNDFQEFVGMLEVPASSVGETQIKDGYHAELIRSSWMMEIGNDKWVDFGGNFNLLLTSDYIHEFKVGAIYNINVTLDASEIAGPTKAKPISISLGYYDTGSSEWVKEGANIPLLLDGVAAVWADVEGSYIEVYYDGTNFRVLRVKTW